VPALPEPEVAQSVTRLAWSNHACEELKNLAFPVNGNLLGCCPVIPMPKGGANASPMPGTAKPLWEEWMCVGAGMSKN